MLPQFLYVYYFSFWYILFLVHVLSKQKRAMHRGMRNPRCYDANLIELNDYLDVFSGAKISDKICVTDLNDFYLTV